MSESEEAGVTFEGRAGGRVYETAPYGTEHLWGTVTEWDPPGGSYSRGIPGSGGHSAGSRGDVPAGWDFVLGRYSG